jgi:class 3 adenylate cyclase
VREQGGDPVAQLRTVQSAFERLLPLADPLLVGVHRRWVEHELAQRAVSAAERRAGTTGLPGSVEVTFLFCDLKDFTAYAEVSGDEAAIGAIDRFFEVVGREHGTSGQFVKSLELLATEDVVKACGNRFEWRPAGERVLRGVTAPLTVYALTPSDLSADSAARRR